VASNFFGSKFKKGVSVGALPEQNFGVLMGTFGLTSVVNINNLIHETNLIQKSDSIFVHTLMHRIIHEADSKQYAYSDFFNFAYGMPRYERLSQRMLHMIDAGINFNLPYPPISGLRLERSADIIIFLDASEDNLAEDLKKVEHYARDHNLKFPHIMYTNIDRRAVSMFKNDSDPSVPIVIYIPCIMDRTLFKEWRMQEFVKDFEELRNFNVQDCIKAHICSTANFRYTREQAHMITALGTFNMLAAKEFLVEALQLKIFGTMSKIKNN
jgi:hypothetical protein